jgi:HK97 gp10 family phage protein
MNDMKGGFETNIEEVFSQFAEMTGKEMSKAVKRALNKAAAQLQTQTKSNLSGVLKSDTSGHGKFNDKMRDAVRRVGAKGYYDEELSAVVHIMGTQTSGSGTYRVRFFEKGTKERYAKTYKGQPLKKPRYLGAIKPAWFFRSANQTIEPQLERIYIEEIDKTIQKINNNKQ